MARTCTICAHEKRHDIDLAFTSGQSYRSIAKQFGLSAAATYRHVSEHVTQAIQQSQAAREEAHGLDVVKQLKAVNAVTLAILKESRDEKKNGLALFAVDRIVKQLELQAKLLGDIDAPPQVTIWLLPEWTAIRSAIVQALAPFPDARVAVAGALATLEVSHAQLN